MRIGKMDRRVRFLQRVTTRDAYGQMGPGWSAILDAADVEIGTVWGDVIHRGSAREKNLEGSIFPESEIAVVIRDPRGAWTLDRTMRIEYNGDTFDVVGWHEIGRNEGFRVYAKMVRD